MERWQEAGRGLVLMQNGQPTRHQLMWIALLDGGRSAALGGHTSLELHGFRPFASEARMIHVVVPRGRRTSHLDGVRVHESRRLERMPISLIRHMPCVDAAVSVLDAASWQPFPRFAVTMLAAAVQQRLVTATDLEAGMEIVGRIRHKEHLRHALRDIETGAESLGELDIARICRVHRLRPPIRQRMRRDPNGQIRFLDCEWETEGGIVVLEIDGRQHMDAANWQADMRRERRIVIDGRRVLRATTYEVRAEPDLVAADLRAAGVPSI